MKSICKLKDIYKALFEFEALFLSTYGITINEGIILCMLSEGSRNAGEICTDCSLSTSRLSKVLGSLEGKGYVIRTIGEKDRRVVIVSLTSKGLDKVTAMKAEDICIPTPLANLLT